MATGGETMNAQAAQLIQAVSAATADTEQTLFTAKLNTEFTRVVLVNTHASEASEVEIRHVPEGATSGAKHRIFKESLAADTVKHVLEAGTESQGITLEIGGTLTLICDRTDTFIMAYGIVQAIRQIHRQ